MSVSEDDSASVGTPPDLVMVVPCHNEAARWSSSYWREIADAVPGEVLLVDDGSTDGTLELMRLAAGDDSRIRVLALPRNVGKGEAVRRGMLQELAGTRPPGAVGFLDADGAFDPDDVRRIWTIADARGIRTGDIDAVWSSRVALCGRRIHRDAGRHYLGRVVATILGAGDPRFPYDSQCGLKFFAVSSSLEGALAEPFSTRWLFEVELLHRWRSFAPGGMRIWEEPVHAWHDVPGSHIRRGEVVRVIVEIVRVLALRGHLARAGRGGTSAGDG